MHPGLIQLHGDNNKQSTLIFELYLPLRHATTTVPQLSTGRTRHRRARLVTEMIDAWKLNATLELMDKVAQLELEAALKYTEAERGYSYATVSEALHVPERTVHEVMILDHVKLIVPATVLARSSPTSGVRIG
jgi:hypothetical protein